MWSEEKLIEIENHLKEKGSLFIEIEEKYDNVLDFLKVFFDVNAVRPTFMDNTKRIIQTGSNRNRSIEDIFRICLYYFPNITFKEVIKALHHPSWFNGFFNYYRDLNENEIGTFICGDLHKCIYNVVKYKHYFRHNRGRLNCVDEWGFSNNDILEIIES